MNLSYNTKGNYSEFLHADFNPFVFSNKIKSSVNKVSTYKSAGSKDVPILDRISGGDPTAVQDCMNQYGGLVWSLARKMLANKEEAEDAVQEIFIEIWKNAERFDAAQASETTFIAMIARRRLIDRLRKSTRQPGIDSFEDILVEPRNTTDLNLQTSVEAKQAAEAMSQLRPEQRKILHLSIVEGYSHSEIADALEMPLGTVKTHARRGLIEVREVLDNGGNLLEVTA